MLSKHLIFLSFLVANAPSAAAFSPALLSADALTSSSSRSSSRHTSLPPPRAITGIQQRHRNNSILSSTPSSAGRSSRTHLQSSISSSISSVDNGNNPFLARRERVQAGLTTLLRVLLPALLAGITAFISLPAMCFRVANFVTRTTDPAKIGMLSDAVGQFISLIGLLYSILVGQVFGFLYSQQEVSRAIYFTCSM